MTQSRMSNLSIKLGIIDNNPSLMHREYHEFYAVHVYLRSIRISLVQVPPWVQNAKILFSIFIRRYPLRQSPPSLLYPHTLLFGALVFKISALSFNRYEPACLH